jgi:hypothetical protein
MNTRPILPTAYSREFRRAETHLAEIGLAIQRAESIAAIERLLVDEPSRSLHLASAALFRNHGGTFWRQASVGWDAAAAEVLTGIDRLLPVQQDGVPIRLDAIGDMDAGFPPGLQRPVLGVPVGSPRHCFAVVLYGGHQAGTDLARNERALLSDLARHAGIAYAQVEREMLHDRIVVLEGELAQAEAAV